MARTKGSRNGIPYGRKRRGAVGRDVSVESKVRLFLERLAASGANSDRISEISKAAGVSAPTVYKWKREVPGFMDRVRAVTLANAKRADGDLISTEEMLQRYPRRMVPGLDTRQNTFFEAWLLTGSREQACATSGLSMEEVAELRHSTSAFEIEFIRVFRLLRVRAEDAIIAESGASSAQAVAALKIIDSYLVGSESKLPEKSLPEEELDRKFFVSRPN